MHLHSRSFYTGKLVLYNYFRLITTLAFKEENETNVADQHERRKHAHFSECALGFALSNISRFLLN